MCMQDGLDLAVIISSHHFVQKYELTTEPARQSMLRSTILEKSKQPTSDFNQTSIREQNVPVSLYRARVVVPKVNHVQLFCVNCGRDNNRNFMHIRKKKSEKYQWCHS